MVGRHNALNALAVVALGDEMGVPPDGDPRGARVASGACSAASRCAARRTASPWSTTTATTPPRCGRRSLGAREAFRRRVVCLFQPHRYTRTRDLLAEFATAFNDADVLLLTDIYAAGEEPIAGATAEALAEAIRACGHRDVTLVPRAELARGGARRASGPGDLVLTLGAGDITAGRPRAARRCSAAPRRRSERPRQSDMTAWQDEIARRVRGEVLRDAPLAPRTAIRVGGPADLLVRPADPGALAELLRAVRELGVPLAILGGGANTLVADAGVRGVVLRLPPDLVPEERPAGETPRPRRRAPPRRRLWLRAHALGLVGMEFVAGIPGTLGGAVAMNAGHPRSAR